MSSRIWWNPSDRTACSRPSGSTAIASQGASWSMRKLSRSDGSAGWAATLSVPGSRSACQMSRASGAGRSGCSAKVQPPGHGVAGPARREAGARVPADVAGIAAQPFPHQPRAIDAAQGAIGRRITPIGPRAVGYIPRHARLRLRPAAACPSFPAETTERLGALLPPSADKRVLRCNSP